MYLTKDAMRELLAGGHQDVVDSPHSKVLVYVSKLVTVKEFKPHADNAMNRNCKEGLELAAREWIKAIDVQPPQRIQKFLGLLNQSPVPSIAAEYIGPNIMEHLRLLAQSGTNINEVLKLSFLHDAALGLKHIHSRNIMHGNLKGSNILISHNRGVFLTDIGVHDAVYVARVDNDLRWKAPERVLNPTIPRSKESDVWSFCMTVLEVVSGLPPFSNLLVVQILANMQQGNAIPLQPNNVSDPLWELLLLCWEYQPIDRLQMAMVAAMIRLTAESARH